MSEFLNRQRVGGAKRHEKVLLCDGAGPLGRETRFDELLKGRGNPPQPVNTPFNFHVSNKSLPSGTYRLDQEFGSEVATLTSLKSGERVRLVRSNATREAGKVISNSFRLRTATS